MTGTYQLVRTPVPVSRPPILDDAQQAVVDRVAQPGRGPLLVLAGPGTGKTTTLVEAVAARVDARHDARPDPHPDVQPQGRRGAARPHHRPPRPHTSTRSRAWTFHAFAYALVARDPPARGRRSPAAAALRPRAGRRRRASCWPATAPTGRRLAGGAARRPRHPRLRRRGPRRCSPGPAARPRPPRPRDARGRGADGPTGRAAARSWTTTSPCSTTSAPLDYAELVHRAVLHAESPTGRDALRARFDLVVVDEYQDTDPAQERLLQALAGDGRDLVVVGDPDQSIYAFRGADVRGLLDFRDRFPTGDGAPRRRLALSVSAPGRRRPAGRVARVVARRSPWSAAASPSALREHRDLGRRRRARRRARSRCCTFPSAAAELERDRRRAAPRAPRRRHAVGARWRCSSGPEPGRSRLAPRLWRRRRPGRGRRRRAAAAPRAGRRCRCCSPCGSPLDPTRSRRRWRPALLLLAAGRPRLLRSAPARAARCAHTSARSRQGQLPRPSAELIREALARARAARRPAPATRPSRTRVAPSAPRRVLQARGPGAGAAPRPTRCCGRCGRHRRGRAGSQRTAEPRWPGRSAGRP